MKLRTPVRRAAGFTFVELSLVIVVIGIVAACAAPRFFDDRTFLHRGYYEELAAALRLSQKLAVVSGCPVRIVIDTVGYTVTLTFDALRRTVSRSTKSSTSGLSR